MPIYKILVVDDDAALLGSVRSYLELKGFSVSEARTGKQCREALQQSQPDAVVMDYFLPDTDGLRLLHEVHAINSSIPVLVMTGSATIDLAVRAMKEGAEQFVAKPFELSVLLHLLEKVFESRRIIRREMATKTRGIRYKRDPFMGSSEKIRRLASAAQSILGTSLPVLIQGETGTGKGVLAEWLTKQGPRSNEAFVDLNCAGLNRELLESDLFGHEREPSPARSPRKPDCWRLRTREPCSSMKWETWTCLSSRSFLRCSMTSAFEKSAGYATVR